MEPALARSATGPLTIGIVIPAYNAAMHIRETLERIDRQTLPPDRVVIVDDGSSDSTAGIASDWISKTGLSAQLIHQPNQGVSAARNAGLQCLGTDLCATVDSDDLMEPEHIATLSAPFSVLEDLVLVFGDQWVLNTKTGERVSFLEGKIAGRIASRHAPSGFKIFSERLFPYLLPSNFIPTSASMFRLDRATSAGGYDTRLKTSEDREFLLRLTRSGSVGFIDRSLTVKQEGHESLTSNQASMHLVANSLLCLLFLDAKLRSEGMSATEAEALRSAIDHASRRFANHAARQGYSTMNKEFSRIFDVTGVRLQASVKTRMRSIAHSINNRVLRDLLHAKPQ